MLDTLCRSQFMRDEAHTTFERLGNSSSTYEVYPFLQHQLINLELKYNVIQLVPRRADRYDGIGDYATFLAHAMLERAGANSVFVVGTSARMEPPRADRW